MNEEYEIIFITEEGRAIKNNKTGKIYHSEFEIIEEKNKEIERLNNIINELEKKLTEEYDYCDKHIHPAFGTGMGVAKRTLDKLKELKENK